MSKACSASTDAVITLSAVASEALLGFTSSPTVDTDSNREWVTGSPKWVAGLGKCWK
jgi:hypothetical protein